MQQAAFLTASHSVDTHAGLRMSNTRQLFIEPQQQKLLPCALLTAHPCCLYLCCNVSRHPLARHNMGEQHGTATESTEQ
jgi:hypothetical protein